MHSPTLPFDYRALLLGVAPSSVVVAVVVLALRRSSKSFGSLLRAVRREAHGGRQ